MEFDPVTFSLKAGWLGMLGGVLSGAFMGIFFLKPDWMGGYGSQPRRLVRLGHIAFFGMGLLNLFYGLSLTPLGVPLTAARWGSLSFAMALLSMPICCFLTAWRPAMHHLFPIPVLSAAAGLGIILSNGY
ncbi:MAG: hypothetical protein VCA35_09315 [Roseibacillus sp.]